MKRIIFIAVSTFFIFTSCVTFHSGGVSSGPLLNLNDTYGDVAIGTSKSLFVFGFGDLDNDALVLDAKFKLRRNRPLKANEYYSNFTTDISKKIIILGIVVINKVTVSADILRSSNTPVSVVIKDSIINSLKQNLPVVADNYFINDVDTFKLGENIYYEAKDGSFGRYNIEFIDRSSVILKSVGEKTQLKVNLMEPLFSTHKRVDDYAVGDTVRAKLFIGYSKAVIIALNNTKAVFKISGQYYLRSISGLKK